MRLHRLTGLEQDKIVGEYQELLATIVDLTDILARPERLTQVIREELIAIREQYGDARRTEINRDHLDLSTEDLIEPQDVVVTLSHAGYAKSQPVTEYQVQRRGGRGKAATSVKDEDFVEKLFVAHTHDTILCFSNRGKVYWKRVFELPQAGRGSRGKPMVNLLPLEEGERINAVLPIKQFDDDHFVFMATSQGTVKKTPLSAFSRPRASGIIALGLDTDDRLVGVALTDGRREIILSSSGGKSIRFNEEEVRPMGREATGVRGIKLAAGQELISLIVVGDGLVLTASANGYGKLTPLEDFPQHGRGGQGVIALQTTERNGEMVAALQVNSDHELMMISSTGTLVRTPVGEISIVGRNTQGVRLIRLGDGERLTGIERIDSLGEDAGRARMRRRRPAVTELRDRRPCRHANLLIYSAPRAITSGVHERSGNKVRPRGNDHARIQFRGGPGHAAPRSSPNGSGRDDRLERQRHVGDGSVPSQQGVHRRRPGGRSRPARAARHPR